jgi:hypothetical protein
VERERQEAAARRYQDFFFEGPGNDPDPKFGREVPASSRDIDPSFAVPAPSSLEDIDPGFTWVAAGPNRFRSVRIATDAQSADSSSLGSISYSDPRPAGQSDVIGQYPDAGAADPATSESDLMPQPVVQSVGELRRPPAVAFGPAPSAAAQSAPRALSYGRVRPQTTPVRAPAANAGHPPAPAPGPSPGQTIAYGALRAPAPSDQELADLRRRQAAFADTTRKIDLQNSWFAAPVLAAPLAVMGLEGAAAWAARSALPEAEQAALQFVEREPYLRVGDTWATRAGRRAHAALKEFVTQKPGWDPEPTIKLPDGRILRPDVRTPPRLRGAKPDPEPFLMDLKPNTPSGLRAAARAVRKYEELTGLKTRPLLYDPKPFI